MQRSVTLLENATHMKAADPILEALQTIAGQAQSMIESLSGVTVASQASATQAVERLVGSFNTFANLLIQTQGSQALERRSQATYLRNKNAVGQTKYGNDPAANAMGGLTPAGVSQRVDGSYAIDAAALARATAAHPEAVQALANNAAQELQQQAQALHSTAAATSEGAQAA